MRKYGSKSNSYSHVFTSLSRFNTEIAKVFKSLLTFVEMYSRVTDVVLKKRKVLYMKKLKCFLWILCGLFFPLVGIADDSDSEMKPEPSKSWPFNMPEVIEDDAGNPSGIRLHLPNGLIEACKAAYWKVKDTETIKHIESCMSSEEGCEEWCSENLSGTEYQHTKRCEFAYALLLANENGYILDGRFCKKSNLDRVLTCISMRGAIRCQCHQQTEVEEYTRNMHWIIEDF